MKEKFYYEAYDIDWFLLSKDRTITHFASGGGTMPEIVVENLEEVEILKDYFRNQPIISDIIINSLSKTILRGTKFGDSAIKRYLLSFKSFAQRGLRSFDYNELEDHTNPQYHLVAKPMNFINFDLLPNSIKGILLKFETDLDFNEVNEINRENTESNVKWYKW